MSDSSKLSADEYLAKCNAMATNAYKGMVGKMEAEAYPSGQFKPGQTVFGRHTGHKFVFRASNEAMAWCEIHPDEPAQSERYKNVLLESLTATDPNAKPAPDPKSCPFCGSKAALEGNQHSAKRVSCDVMTCGFTGPSRDTGEEAIAAWNSIEVKSEPAKSLDAMREAAKEDIFKAFMPNIVKTPFSTWADDAPLTEEWLRKAGLQIGIHDDAYQPWVKIESLLGHVMLTFANGGGSISRETAIKSIGDARQLCRLLGVDLKEGGR